MKTFFTETCMIKENSSLWSSNLELFYVTKGQASFLCGTNQYLLKDGDLICINPYEIFNIQDFKGHGLQISIDLEGFCKYAQLSEIPRIHLNTAALTILPGSTAASDLCNSNGIDPLHELILHIIALADAKSNPNIPDTSAQSSDSRILKPDLLRQRKEFDLISDLILNFRDLNQYSRSCSNGVLTSALNFIENNFKQRISVHDIARACHISDTHLTHVFKDTIAMPPSEFLQYTRAQYARTLLAKPYTLAKIAEMSGFDQPRNLNSAFKKFFDQMPAEYRKNQTWPLKKDKITEDSLYPQMNKTAKDSTYPKKDKTAEDSTYLQSSKATEDSAYPKELKDKVLPWYCPDIDLNRPALFTKPSDYFSLLEFDCADQLLNSKSRKSLEECQKIFHFKYIHLRSIFDNGLLSYMITDGRIIWDFANLNDIFEFLISINLTPVITLSSIPNILSPHDHHAYFGFSNISMPQHVDHYCALISDFIINLLDIFGINEIKKWRIGINYLPASILGYINSKSFDDGDYIDSIQDIFDLYVDTYKTIRSLCPEIKIGAPEGDIEDLKSNAVLDWILNYFKINDCIPDYFPFHYCWNILVNASLEGEMLICDREINYKKSVEYVALLHERISKVFDDKIPLYCMNQANTGPILLNETVFSAAVKTAFSAQILPYLKYSGIGPYRDSLKSSKNNNVFNGHWGLVSGHQIHRPFYYALQEMCKLQQEILYMDDHVLASTDTQRRYIAILITNAPDFKFRVAQNKEKFHRLPIITTDQDCFDSDTNLSLFSDPQNINRIIGGKSLHVQFALQGLKNHDYMLESFSITTDHGSAFDEWLSEGAFDPIHKSDIELINHHSLPAHFKKNIHPSGGQWQFECTLEACEIRSVVISLI